MVSNLGKTLEKMEIKAMETAINAIEIGMDNEVIIKITGLTDEEINDIRKERSH